MKRYAEAVARHGFDVLLIESPNDACERISDDEFDTVVSAYPLESGALGRIVSALRTPAKRSCNCGLVLLTPPANLRAASGLVGRGVSKALSCEEDPAVVGIVVGRIAEASRETLERLPIQIEVECHLDEGIQFLKTENISSGGMLIATNEPPAEGIRFRFSLGIPGDPINGQAKVVRRVSTKREPVNGFGARFLSFDNDGKTRLLAELEAVRELESVRE